MKNIRNITINGNFISDEEAYKMGFQKESFSYYVDATITEGDTSLIIKKCKAIVSSSGRETIYFLEQDSGIKVFTLSENPNMTINKSL
jgi:hypothetical protein